MVGVVGARDDIVGERERDRGRTCTKDKIF